jgi:hypothetical protein
MLAPRVLILLPDHWPRALLRAELREAGYDAVGAPTPVEAHVYAVAEPGRGPVRLVIVDEQALSGDGARSLERLLARHHSPAAVLIQPASAPVPPGTWNDVLRRPLTIRDIVDCVKRFLPIPAGSRLPLDAPQ